MLGCEKRSVGTVGIETLAPSNTTSTTTTLEQVADTEPQNVPVRNIDIEANGASITVAESEKLPPHVDPNEVDWDGPDDPQNPLNWSVARRAFIVGMAMAIVFST